MTVPSTPEHLFDRLLAERPAQPFVTYYDEATGERSELSAKSLANWVAKTHHLLGDELGLDVGDHAYLDLPAHWISVPILLGCLTAGLALIGAADGAASDAGNDAATANAQADVAFVAPDRAAAALSARIPDIYAINPDAAAVGFGDAPPDGLADYVTAVRPQADKWPSVQLRGQAADLCLLRTAGNLTRGDVTALAQQRATELGLAIGARALTTRDWTGPDDWIDSVLAVLSVGGSLVIVRNTTDEDVITRRMSQERAAVRI